MSLLTGLKARGSALHLFFLWIPSPELAIARIKDRISEGGHYVPAEDVRRRFARGINNFFSRYEPWVDAWMLFENSKANDESFLKNSIKDNLKVLVVLEFLINFYVFSLWIELLLVPVFGILGGLLGIAASNKQYEAVQKSLNYVMAIIGTFFIGYALYMTVSDFNNFFTLNNFESFILPVLLTIMFLPFIYSWALYANYETLFIRLQFFVRDKSLLSYVKKKTILAFRLNLWSLNKWSKYINTLRFEDHASVDEAIRDFKESKFMKNIKTV